MYISTASFRRLSHRLSIFALAKARSHQRGLGLLEVMLALALLSTGCLVITHFQLASLETSLSRYHMTRAQVYLSDLNESLWAARCHPSMHYTQIVDQWLEATVTQDLFETINTRANAQGLWISAERRGEFLVLPIDWAECS
jgi:Tfp pilus assembly protein PilV